MNFFVEKWWNFTRKLKQFQVMYSLFFASDPMWVKAPHATIVGLHHFPMDLPNNQIPIASHYL
jgi:hypothetical protein